MKKAILISIVAVVATVAFIQLESTGFSALSQGEDMPGFLDTPFLPDGRWRVHDARRPRPETAIPPTPSAQERPGVPPSDAVVLFGGSDLSAWWTPGGNGEVREAAWQVRDGFIEVVPGSGHILSHEKFGDCQVHVEWATPTVIEGEGQGRGNSGIMLMGGRYEIQVLDSYENPTYADGQAGAIYGQYPPLVNASLPPGQWQTFDIIFEAPQFDGDRVVKPAYATVLHNGLLLHHRKAFIGQVAHKEVGAYRPHEAEAPLLLQDHGDKVRFRNIWVRRLSLEE